MTFDEARARNPGLALTLYALDPLGPVTLEIISPEGEIFKFESDTGQGALDLAFPPPAPESAFD